MADSLTDAQIVEEFKSYGETVALPIKANKRPILIKKLNHLRIRNRKTISPDPSASSKITEVVTRSLRRRPNVSPLSVTVRGRKPTESDRIETRSTSRPSSSISTQSPRRRYDETFESPSVNSGGSGNRSHLYPDLSAFRSRDVGSDSRDTSFGDRSTIPFESSDSDFEGSSYEVTNKSVNTSFGFPRRGNISSNHVNPNSPSGLNRRTSPASNLTPHRSNQPSRAKVRRRFYPEHVSFGLVALVLAFFVVIFFSYVFVRKELFIGWFFADSSPQTGKERSLLCSRENPSDCCTSDEVQMAHVVVKDLYSDLSSKKGRVICGDAPEAEQQLSGDVFLKDLHHRKGITHAVANETRRLYNCCLDLILANPQWNLRALTPDGKEALEKSEVAYLESAVASMGFLCRLRRSFARVMWSLFVLVAGVASLGMVLMLLWWRIQAKEREEQRVFAMVEQIIDLLKEQHEVAQSEDSIEEAGLAVHHVRDQLLPPSRRRALQHIWDKAVRFIEANESRVRLETQIIEGEEFAVWRWIQAMPNGGKVWQGQAFGEHNESSASTNIYSPTPCLKIRNMFDKEVESEAGWEESVKDALLEKCRNINSLVHIYIDSSSTEGCVYVKCDSKEAAGRVRQALHGWWFDGRLVTVKHLKADRYHNRWPEAKFAYRPLQPSTNQMRSLAQPYHRSSLEMT